MFFGALVDLLWTTVSPRPGHYVAAVLDDLLVLGIGYSRLCLNAHWLSDVLGAAAPISWSVLPGTSDRDRSGRRTTVPIS
jgi:membrane-associated phospholipid phosphatase